MAIPSLSQRRSRPGSRTNSEFTFKLGIVDGKVITVEEIKDLASLPGKEELFSKLLFLIQSPAQRLATVINATGRDLAVVLGQGVQKEKFAGAAAPAAAPVDEAAPAPVAEAAPEVAAVVEEENSSEDAALVAETHAIEAPTPAEAIAENPASEADAVAQPENGTASQAGEAATTEPVEG